ncbi:DUF2235 domain protein [Rhizoctonia solani 123E]|uniref:DUF2235 domain protein n=1 Tax=Rhizoctonia solani 123E TaxID=1423351 RepID=A0A074SCX3_9AGAM|nr:DUF2235 domain protein [Rhizoctonia solani 123E]
MPRLPTIDTRQASAKPRTLVLCFDGTTNIYDNTNTNVVKLFSLLKRDNREEQMVYYQPGVGTYVPPGILLPITLQLAKIADQAIALYLDKHVMGGYEFLMKHYNDGDKICLFGFSRGAYTARALAGMLHKVGLLPPDNVEQISFAYQMYKRSDKVGFKESAGFKRTFSREVEIEFVGVWDTVSSVRLLIPRHLPFTKSNPIVKTFRHAVSLDERRAKFRHHLWHVHSSGGQCSGKEGDGMITEASGTKPRLLDRIINRLGGRPTKTRSADSSGAFEYEAAMSAEFQTNTWENDVLEVWFAGCHGDVGGGAVKDTEEYQLSNISLRWMIRQIISSQCGIKFNAGALKAMHISPATVSFGIKAPSSRYSSPSDVKLVSAAQEQEMGDALADVHDNVLKPAWWPLELIPLLHTTIDRKGDSHIRVRPNLFKGRRPHTSNEKIKIHRTVQYRINNSGSNKYEYKARITEENIEWVD